MRLEIREPNDGIQKKFQGRSAKASPIGSRSQLNHLHTFRGFPIGFLDPRDYF